MTLATQPSKRPYPKNCLERALGNKKYWEKFRQENPEWIKFWSKVEKTPTCWFWNGWTNPDGYGQLKSKISMLAHRWVYITCIGKIPKGLVIDHLCRNRNCVNPLHLEVVTNKTNVLRGYGFSALNARKTHCKRGHILSKENLVNRRKERVCKICFNQLSRIRKANKREEN